MTAAPDAQVERDGDRLRVLALLKRHGWNATSFQILEPGFRYWFDGDSDGDGDGDDAACVGYVAWQAVRVLRGRGGKVGSCCAKGCDPAAASAPAKPAGQSVVFLPESALTRRGRRA